MRWEPSFASTITSRGGAPSGITKSCAKVPQDDSVFVTTTGEPPPICMLTVTGCPTGGSRPRTDGCRTTPLTCTVSPGR